WSYDLLSEQEKALLCRLSIFAGGWTLEAAEDVGGGEILDLLSQLVDKSLVLYEDQGGQARYRLLETVRQYGRERLTEAGEVEAVSRQHRDYFLRLAEEAEPKLDGRDAALWLNRLETEHDNLRAALEWSLEAVEGEKSDAALRLAGALWRFWNRRGYLS